MRKVRVIFVLGFVLVLAGAVFFVVHDAPLPFVTLADGTILRVEQVTYGKRGNFRLEQGFERLKLDIARHLPKKWGDRLAKAPPPLTVAWDSAAERHTNGDALHIWITHREAGGKYLDVLYRYAQIVDEHGCVFEVTSQGGVDDGRLGPLITGGNFSGSMSYTPRAIVSWHSWEAFPRGGRSFSLKVFGEGAGATNHLELPHLVGEFVIHNAGRSSRRAPGWKPEALPIVKEAGKAAFVLKNVRVVPNPSGSLGNNFQLTPVFEVRQEGQPSDEWEMTGMELSDSTGNVAADTYRGGTNVRCLCFQEPAWKLAAEFVGSPALNPGSNELWTIRDIKVPAAGRFTAIEGEHILSGAKVKSLALGGPGWVNYSNLTVVGASVMNPAHDAWSVGQAGSSSYGSARPQLSFVVTGIRKDQRLSVFVTDDQGRHFQGRRLRVGVTKTNAPADPAKIQFLDYYYTSPPPSGLLFGPFRQPPGIVVFDLPEDSKAVDVTFCVHEPRLVEFIFKPPERKGGE